MQVLPSDLRRTAHGEAILDEAFRTVAFYQEEQARIAADLLERETWTLNAVLAASGPIWRHLASPTLRFTPHHTGGPSVYHVELGRFAHLAALVAPSAEEQALIEATTCCWARVFPHQERHLAGQTGALACSYVPMPAAEAVALLGFGRIMARIEAAAREAGQVLLAQAQEQGERQRRLLDVERMLGWEPDPSATPSLPHSAGTRLAVALLGPESRSLKTIGLAFAALVLGLTCLLIGLPQVLIVLVPAAIGLLSWHHIGAG